MITHELLFGYSVLTASVELREIKFFVKFRNIVWHSFTQNEANFPDSLTAVISEISKFFARIYKLYFSLLKYSTFLSFEERLKNVKRIMKFENVGIVFQHTNIR